MMYTEADRHIFKYHNGAEEVYADPLAALRQVMFLTGGDPDSLTDAVFYPKKNNEVTGDISAMTTQDQRVKAALNAKQAEQKIIAVVREVFEMKPYSKKDNTGAQDSLCLIVWREFTRYIAKKKRAVENLRRELLSMDTPQDSPTATTSTSA